MTDKKKNVSCQKKVKKYSKERDKYNVSIWV